MKTRARFSRKQTGESIPSIKLFSGELSMDFTKLSATELVNLLLAFFSIALSAAFYFAATSQSNQFYDNVNKFSKDTSELLGRLDEQVKGLGGRQSELKESIDKYYFKGGQGGAAEQAKQAVQTKAKEVEANLSRLVTELLDRANLAPAEKSRIQEELRSKDAELGELRERIGRLSSVREGAVRRHTIRKIEEYGVDKAVATPLEEWAVPVILSGVRAYRQDLLTLGLVSRAEPSSIADVTEAGKKLLLSALEQVVERGKEA